MEFVIRTLSQEGFCIDGMITWKHFKIVPHSDCFFPFSYRISPLSPYLSINRRSGTIRLKAVLPEYDLLLRVEAENIGSPLRRDRSELNIYISDATGETLSIHSYIQLFMIY